MRTGSPCRKWELDQEASGHRIKILLMKKNWRTAELSRIMNVSKQAVYRWYKGETMPALDHLLILGQILDTPVDDLLVLRMFER